MNKSETIRTANSDFCPCGSNKFSIDSCAAKHREYEYCGKNYLGRDIYLDRTEILMAYTEIHKRINEIIELSQGDGFGVNYAVQKLKELYSIYERAVQQINQYISCRKGCSECCYVYVDTTAIEAELIRRYVKENFQSSKVSELACKAKETAKEMPHYQDIENADDNEINIIAKNYFRKRIPCLFLTDKGECSIYEVRPVNCRIFNSVSSPERCRINNGSSNIKRIRPFIMDELLAAADIISVNVNRFKDLRRKSPGKSIHSIYKSLPYWFINGFDCIDKSI